MTSAKVIAYAIRFGLKVISRPILRIADNCQGCQFCLQHFRSLCVADEDEIARMGLKFLGFSRVDHSG